MQTLKELKDLLKGLEEFSLANSLHYERVSEVETEIVVSCGIYFTGAEIRRCSKHWSSRLKDRGISNAWELIFEKINACKQAGDWATVNKLRAMCWQTMVKAATATITDAWDELIAAQILRSGWVTDANGDKRFFMISGGRGHVNWFREDSENLPSFAKNK